MKRGTMAGLPARGVFVTGNDTEVGKTYVACELIRGLVAQGVAVAGYKPVASGAEEVDGKLLSRDAAALWDASGKRGELRHVCPQVFAAPIAPHLAARAEDRRVDSALLTSGATCWSRLCDFLVVEGAGGLMSPLADDVYNIDLAHQLNYPLVVVLANRIGAINQCLQTLITATSYGEGVDVAGIILNDVEPTPDESAASNELEIVSRCDAPLLAHVRYDAAMEMESINWQQLHPSLSS